MRLLDTNTKKLTEFQSDIPPYAILSHVWGLQEVTFHDITDLNKAKELHGYAKIDGACTTAQYDGFQYIWIDTCCINKDSSAELSEAINSMYTWYKNARVCYAYLSDVLSEADHEAPHSLFTMSQWFTRGWTLQELIAPQRVVFYTRDWVDIGTKATLQTAISAITRISAKVIVGELALDDVPVAVRMSWAADRNTMREEDVAYSLMGLFDINMPLLYGEGRKAFIRLQHEIIRKSNDHSIFAWRTTEDSHRGILARSPSEFRDSGSVERILRSLPGGNQTSDYGGKIPYSITNQGLHIELPIVLDAEGEEPEYKMRAFLNCRFSGQEEPIVITLLQPRSLQSSDFIRSETTSLTRTSMVQGPARRSSLYIMDDYQTTIRRPPPIAILMEVKVPPDYGDPRIEATNCELALGNQWKYINRSPYDNDAVLVFNEPRALKQFAVIVGARGEGVVWCDVLTHIKPDDHSGSNVLTTYRSTHQKKPKRSLDRASAELTDGWSVTVSLGVNPLASSNNFRSLHIAKIEIKKSPRQRALVPTLERPNSRIACLVIPPTPEHGFTVNANDITPQHTISDVSCVQHLGCYVMYMKDGWGVGVLTFKNSSSKKEFSLLVGGREGTIQCAIEWRRPRDPSSTLLENENRLKTYYSVVLDQERTVFVTVRRCTDTSVADFVINVSMKRRS